MKKLNVIIMPKKNEFPPYFKVLAEIQVAGNQDRKGGKNWSAIIGRCLCFMVTRVVDQCDYGLADLSDGGSCRGRKQLHLKTVVSLQNLQISI